MFLFSHKICKFVLINLMCFDIKCTNILEEKSKQTIPYLYQNWKIKFHFMENFQFYFMEKNQQNSTNYFSTHNQIDALLDEVLMYIEYLTAMKRQLSENQFLPVLLFHNLLQKFINCFLFLCLFVIILIIQQTVPKIANC